MVGVRTRPRRTIAPRVTRPSSTACTNSSPNDSRLSNHHCASSASFAKGGSFFRIDSLIPAPVIGKKLHPLRSRRVETSYDANSRWAHGRDDKQDSTRVGNSQFFQTRFASQLISVQFKCIAIECFLHFR